MILLPQYRTSRRSAAAADLTVLQTVFTGGTSAGTSATLTFTSPSAGELMIAFLTTTSSSFTGVPSGWNLVHSKTHSTVSAWCYAKVAGVSEPTSHVWTVATSQAFGIWGARFSNGSVHSYGSNSGTTITSLAAASSGIDVPTNSFVGGVYNLSNTGAPEPDNGYSDSSLGISGDRAVYRKYTSGGASENTTATWLNGRTVASLLVCIRP